MVEVTSRVYGLLCLWVLVKQDRKCVHLGSSLLINSFGGYFPVSGPAWRGSLLVYDQPCACLSRATVSRQRDPELVSGATEGVGVTVAAGAGEGADAEPGERAGSGGGAVTGGGGTVGYKGVAAGAVTGVAVGGGINTYSRVGAGLPVPAWNVRADGINSSRVWCQVTSRGHTTVLGVASSILLPSRPWL